MARSDRDFDDPIDQATAERDDAPAGEGVLTALEAAAYLKVSRRTLDRLPLPREYVGRLPRWRKSDLDAYLASHRIEPTERQPTLAVVRRVTSPRKPAVSVEAWRRQTLARIRNR